MASVHRFPVSHCYAYENNTTHTDENSLEKLTLKDNVWSWTQRPAELMMHQAGFTPGVLMVSNWHKSPRQKWEYLPYSLTPSLHSEIQKTHHLEVGSFLLSHECWLLRPSPTLCSYLDSRFQKIREKEGRCRNMEDYNLEWFPSLTLAFNGPGGTVGSALSAQPQLDHFSPTALRSPPTLSLDEITMWTL